jgi:hypothetical protein
LAIGCTRGWRREKGRGRKEEGERGREKRLLKPDAPYGQYDD